MRLSDRIQNKITRALDSLPNEDMHELPDYDFFLVNMPETGLRAMVLLIIPVDEQDNSAPRYDIDPYAGQDEFNDLIARLWQEGTQARSGVVLSGQPGLARRSRSGLVLPQ